MTPSSKSKRDPILRWLLPIFSILVVAIIYSVYFSSLKNSVSTTQEATLTLPAKAETPPKDLSFSALMKLSEAKQIKSIILAPTEASGELVSGEKFQTQVEPSTDLMLRLTQSGADVSVAKKTTSNAQIFLNFLYGFFMVIMIVWIFRMLRMSRTGKGGSGVTGMMAGMGGTYTPVNGQGQVTFKDVAGVDQAKYEVQEIVEFLKNPGAFSHLGGRIPRGVLMSGAPGTGKTLLARAVAGEAKVPFFSASGSEFNGFIVGLGVARVKSLFTAARKHTPCIIFIDEIDAIGQQRGRSMMASDSDREATLNQLLIEMDGFSGTEGIIVIAATNRPELLDQAILRPGRFDRQVHIDLPDVKGREEILTLHSAKVKLGKVNLSIIARGTPGFSGADLANLINEGALLAVRHKHKVVQEDDLEEARDKMLLGSKRQTVMHKDDLKLTAYHEAGHAYLGTILESEAIDPIYKATIIPRGRALGMVVSLPERDHVSLPLKKLRANLVMSLGGRVAEEIFFGKDWITTGAESDINYVTNYARYAVTQAGLSQKVGLINVAPSQNAYGMSASRVSGHTQDIVDAEVKRMIDEAHQTARMLIQKGKAKVKLIAETLLKKETLTGAEIKALVAKK